MKTKSGKLILYGVVLCAILYYCYDLFLREIILNNSDRKVTIDLSKDNILVLDKFESQQTTNQLELELSGKTKNHLTYYISSALNSKKSCVTVKKGELHHILVVPWKESTCTLFFPNSERSKIELTYRFTGN